ncbi:MAG: hypothetical protein J6M57_06870 [Acidaminococcaceae bacterium]|nr:hypothetical protein [Acidaminococcaceae bacterium]MBQ5345526.1 hypothetical protein [Acidaminococcaceae bacterium]MBQ9256751.1 hypothetical protein [Acidaminococcaceae bacterium]
MAVVERLGGCCHGGQCVVKEKAKSGIKTVTEVLLSLKEVTKSENCKKTKGE